MKSMKLLIAAIALIGLVRTAALAKIDGFEYEAFKAGRSPKIDGDISEWSGAPSMVIKWLNDPIDEVDEQYFSNAMAVYDETYLYVAIENLEPNPGRITTVFKNHDDSIWNDDENEVFMNPRNDSARPFFKYTVTPANVTLDSEVGGAGNAWEPKLDSATSIGKDKWVLEARLPLEDLGVKGSPAGQTWDFNVTRHIVSGVDLWTSWTTIGASFNNEAGFGIITFSEKVFAFAVSPKDKTATTWGTLKALRSQ